MNAPELIKELGIHPNALYEKYRKFEDWKKCGLPLLEAATVTFEVQNRYAIFFIILGLEAIEDEIEHIREEGK